MRRVRKIRLRLTKKQQMICRKRFGILRFLWNNILATSIKKHKETGHFMYCNEFAKDILPRLIEEYPWIKECPSKARKEILRDFDKALSRSFESEDRGFPKFKKKKDPVNSFYFIKDGIRFVNDLSHIWIPTFGVVKLCETGYITEHDIPHITSGRIVMENDIFYITFNLQAPMWNKENKNITFSDGMGIDVGVKDYATIYHNSKYIHIPHVNKTNHNIINCEKKIKHLQEIVSHKTNVNLRKYGYVNIQAYYKAKNKKKGEATKIFATSSILKLRKRINKLYSRLSRIRKDFIHKLCLSLVITKPRFITIEDLQVQKMLQYAPTSTLADHIQKSMFYYFRSVLEAKSLEYNIEIRLANKFFASSKTCCICGNKNKDLTLNDRVYRCDKCGNEIDRDENAANNLYHLKKYKYV